MHVDPETPRTTVTDNFGDGSQAQKNRQSFHLALLITTALPITTLWVSNTQTPAHADTQADNDLHTTAPTAPRCPPGSGGPSGSGEGQHFEFEVDFSEGGPSRPGPGGGDEVLPNEILDENFPKEGPRGPDGRPGPLNDRERLAIWRYTQQSDPINKALESGDPAALRRHANAIRTLKRALKKLPDYEGLVHRTKRYSLEVLRSYRINETISIKSFTSTTKDDTVTYGTVRFYINTDTGKDIDAYSEFAENEVLLMPGTKFLVEEKYRESNGDWIIVMSEVD